MLKEKFEEAQAKKDNDIKSFVWKGKKVNKNGQFVQEEIKMVDATNEQLKQWYDKCQEMLYNNSKDTPGRYILLDIINDQRDKCNAELFVRWLEQDKATPRFTFSQALSKFLSNNPIIEMEDGTKMDTKNAPISIAVGDCPKEFGNLTIDTVMNACLDCLGRFSKQHITLAFLLKQGVYLTEEDQKNIGNGVTKQDYVKNYLDLRPMYDVHIGYKGLPLNQMKAMVNLPKYSKYSELTNLQLEVLRNRILFSLERDVRFHISQWEERQRQIRLVAKSKGISIG